MSGRGGVYRGEEESVSCRCWEEESEDGEDYCRSLVTGEEVCRGRMREASCEGREETEMLLWIERGRQGGGNLIKL